MQCSSHGSRQCSTFLHRCRAPTCSLFLVTTDTQQYVSHLQDIQLQAAGADRVPLPGPNILSDVLRVIQYLPQALMYIAHNCTHLEELSLKLLGQALVNSSRGNNIWDHPSLLKRPHCRLSQVWSHCTSLRSLTLVNIPSRYES